MPELRLSALAVAGLFAAVLWGCSDAPAVKSDKVTVRLWISPLMTELRDHLLYEQFADKFMEENPDIRVQVEVIPWAKRMQKMITAVNGGHAPDAAYLGLDFMPQLHALDILEPIDQYLTPEELDDYTSVARESVSIDGQMFLLPMDRSIVAALYNKDLFAKAGLDPEKPPANWSDVRAAAEAITKDTNGDGHIDQWGVAYIFGGESVNLTFWPMLWQAGGEALAADGSRVTFNAPEGVEALNFVSELYKEGHIPPAYMGTKAQDFARGTVGYWWGVAPIFLINLRNDSPDLNLGVAPVLTHKRQMSYSTIGSYGVFKTSQHKEETMRWLRFLTRPDNMRKFCREIYRVPTKKTGGPLYADDPQLAEFERQSQFCRPDVLNEKIRDIMALLVPEIQSAALGNKTPEQALDDAAKAANDVLARARRSERENAR